jgi:hypothetical protein
VQPGLAHTTGDNGGADAARDWRGTLVAVNGEVQVAARQQMPRQERPRKRSQIRSMWRGGSTIGIIGATLLGGCSDDAPASDAVQFCDQARANTALIVSPPLATEAELDETMDFYRLMGELAPIAIAEQWNRLVDAMETAAAIVPGDPASAQQVAMTAYAVERSAYEVKVWLNQNCGVDLPITTIAPQDPVPAQTVPVTTVPGGTAPGTSAP